MEYSFVIPIELHMVRAPIKGKSCVWPPLAPQSNPPLHEMSYIVVKQSSSHKPQPNTTNLTNNNTILTTTPSRSELPKSNFTLPLTLTQYNQPREFKHLYTTHKAKTRANHKPKNKKLNRYHQIHEQKSQN